MLPSLIYRKRYSQYFLRWCLLVAVNFACSTPLCAAELPEPSAGKLPRWRGFNLTERMSRDAPETSRPFVEEDFRWIAELGFNFVRIPLDYRLWIKDGNWEHIDQEALKEVDRAVELGRKYGLHVCLNFHRAPGFTIATPKEPRNLWTDSEAQRVAAGHWAAFARRYKGIPNRNLSFNLFNEPPEMDPDVYFGVAQKMAQAIRAEDPDRLIIADGMKFGGIPVPELRRLKMAQMTRGYQPLEISHYAAHWIPHALTWPMPRRWPDPQNPICNNEWILRRFVRPWKQLERQGIGVMIGEFGAYRFTPHKTTMAWMKDNLSNWQEAGWGWALWNFRGAFGILDSGRPDVVYEDFHGHKLDREMLDLLQKY